jgi:predicted RNA-binding Zn ribbon-like protein
MPSGRASWPRIGGALCLDFCNTLSWRLTPEPVDRLHSDADLLDWAGLPPAPDDPERFERALALRAAIIAAFETGDADPVRRAYAGALASARVRDDHGTVALEWPGDPLSPVAHSAWTLLTDPGRHPVRVCEGQGCGWLFLDETRNASRRWCAADDCGRRERVRRHRARLAGQR